MAHNSDSFKARILTASAGSGKTFNLAYQYIYDVLRDQPADKGGMQKNLAYRSILAVTFTNKATEEMKSRILTQLNNLATGKECEFTEMLIEQTGLTYQELKKRAIRVRNAILHDYSRFSILTNDTFFQRIVRAFVKELGGDLNYAIELDTAPVVQKSIDNLISEVDSNEELREWLLDFAEENIEEGGQWNLKKGIMKLKKEIFREQTKEAIEAIGDKQHLKEMVEAYIEATEREIEPTKLLAEQAEQIISSSGIDSNNFAANIPVFFAEFATLKSIPELKSSIQKLCSSPAKSWFKSSIKPTAQMFDIAEQLQPLLTEIIDNYEQVKYLFNSCRLLRQNFRSFALLNDLYNHAIDICNKQNTMLLSQTKHTISKLITSQDDAPFIYEKVGNHFEKFMIDEFQDTSFKEWENFLPLLRNAIAESADLAVLIVGDIKQSIYRWRGSDWNILRSIAPTDLKRNNTPIHQKSLGCNYRSLPEVVKFNNNTMRTIADSQNEHLNNILSQALNRSAISQAAYDELYNSIHNAYTDLKQDFKDKYDTKGYICATAHYTTEPDIISRIKELVYKRGFMPCDITILVRTNAQAEMIAKVLLDAGVKDPSMRFGIMTQEALTLNSSHIIQFILAIMRYAIDRRDTISLGIYNRHYYNLDLYRTITTSEEAFFDKIANLPPQEAFEQIMIRYSEFFEGQEAYTQAFHENIIKFCASKVADLKIFLDWWDEKGGDKSVSIEKDKNAIEIMTIHKSKGLENKVIIIPYCNWDLIPRSFYTSTIWAAPSPQSGLDNSLLFPIQSNKDAANSIFAEQYYKEYIYSHIDAINMLYVALTRPKEQLHIFFPAMKADRYNKFKDVASNVGELLFKALGMEKEYIFDKEQQQQVGSIVYTQGLADGPAKREEEKDTHQTIVLKPTPTSEFNLKLKFPSRHFTEAQKTEAISPRDKGIILHKVMERSNSRSQISQAIEQLKIDGNISATECQKLEQQINQALLEPTAQEWFSADWDAVYTESGIIIPKEGIKRPDRVMVKGNRAVVVDYKFGKSVNEYREQMAQYCQLLSQMGYSEVSGYLWYVRQGKIEQVR